MEPWKFSEIVKAWGMEKDQIRVSHNGLPAFAECPVRMEGDECEKYASAGFAEAVKMARAEARGASFRKSGFFRFRIL
jgi:hypothetical protein